MSEPKPRTSLSNVLTLVTTLFAVGVAYGATSTRISNLEQETAELQRSLLPMVESIRDDTTDLRVKMERVQSDIEWIKKSRQSQVVAD